MSYEALKAREGTTIAAATTLVLPSNGEDHTISGTTTITAIDDVDNNGLVYGTGAKKVLTFSGASPMTHNGTSFILIGGASRTNAAGDVSVFRHKGSGNWQEIARNKAAPAFSGARVYNSTTQSIPDPGGWTALTFDTERYDTDAYHSTSSDQSRLVIPSDGYYRIGANVGFQSSSALRGVRLHVNGTDDIALELLTVSGELYKGIHAEWFFEAGDYVEVQLLQLSGGALNSLAVPAQVPEFWISKIG